MTPMDLPPRVSRSSRELLAGVGEGLLPTDGLELAVGLADQRLGEALGVSWRSRMRNGLCYRGSRR